MVRNTVVVLLFFVASVCVAKLSYKVYQMNEEEDTVFGSKFFWSHKYKNNFSPGSVYCWVKHFPGEDFS